MERFVPQKSTDFLVHLAYTVAVCIENAFSQAHLRRQSELDILTNVNNRRFFENQLLREIARASREHLALSCLFIDIDHFKRINDDHGHHIGDRCLRHVADHISRYLRKSDLLARYGGEEFVVLLPGANISEAHDTAERIGNSAQDLEFEFDSKHKLKLTLSIGVTTWDPKQSLLTSVEEVAAWLVKSADQAMYTAKNSGRNQVIVHHS